MKELLIYQKGESTELRPLPPEQIHAGFETSTADYQEESIDLNAYVSKDSNTTFYARVVGECTER